MVVLHLLAETGAIALWANSTKAADAASAQSSWTTLFGVFSRFPLLFVSIPLPVLLISLYFIVMVGYLLYFLYVLVAFLLRGGFYFLYSIQLWSCDHIDSYISVEGSSLQAGLLDPNQERYKYQSLGCDGDFRLLQIRKGFSGGIRVRIVHTNLASAPKYNCVSYTWGALPANQALVIDGAALPISTVVQDGIKRLASLWVTRLIWIDAVCINQSNVEEKGQQIIQELALAKDIKIICGNWSVPWKRFVSFIDLNYQSARDGHQRIEPNKLRGMNQILILEHLRTLYNRDNRSSLSDILRQCANFQATDQRDKIYSLLGIVITKHSNALVPNYLPDKQTWSLYRDVQEMLLADPEYGFDILNLAGIGWTRKVDGLPSWVPDWSYLPESYTGTSIQNYDEDFKADLLDWMVRPISHIHFHQGDKRLVTLRGFQVDRIIALSSEDPRSGNNILESCISWFTETYTMACKLGDRAYPNGQSLHDAYAECLKVSERVAATYPMMSRADRDPAHCPYTNIEWQSLRKSWLGILKNKLKADAHKTKDLTSLLQEALQEVPEDHVEQYKQDEANMTEMRLATTHAFTGSAISPHKSGFAEPSRFAITEKGYMALVPPLTSVGDEICTVLGAATAYVMRAVGKSKLTQRYELVGGCFIHGMMYGEASEMGFAETSFTLQ